MTDREDLEIELIARLQVAANSTLYPSTRITTLIQNAYIWATQITIWHDLVKAMYSHTTADYEYYDYPSEFRSESIVRLEYDDEDYERVNFEDYLDFKEDNTTSTRKMFASFGRRFFIHPTPSTTGTDNLVVWGAVQADALSSASSVPIFSYNKEEGNEGVVRKAFSVAIKRQDPNLSVSEEREAVAILIKLSKEEQERTQRNRRVNKPMYAVPDYFSMGQGASTPYRRFNYDPGDYV